MPTRFTLTIDQAAMTRIGVDAALADVTDVTRRVFVRANILTPVDTGRLRAGNMMRVERTPSGARGEVFNDTAYAQAVHDGTHAHTIRPHPQTITIRPKHGKYLRFEVDGRVVYAKQVRTQKPLRFLVGGRPVFARSVRMPARRGRPWMYRALVEIAVPRGYRLDAT
jgi:hypothetical protein